MSSNSNTKSRKGCSCGKNVEEEDNLLHWMLDNGTESEIEVAEMSRCQCVLAFSSIFTIASPSANILYDLDAYPEWFEVLREDIKELSKELGPPGQNMDISPHPEAPYISNSEVISVPLQPSTPDVIITIGPVTPQRQACRDIEFKEGMTIPAGAQVAFASYEYSMDPLVYPDPLRFDPMSSYRKRMSAPDQQNLHNADMIHPGNLVFGYGNLACPGRQFAVAEMKTIMSRLLYEFEFKFLDGKTRPALSISMRFALRIKMPLEVMNQL